MGVDQAFVAELEDAARLAGQFIAREAAKFKRSDAELKSFNNLVSYVDRTAEDMLTEACLKLLPHSGFINEEGGESRTDAEHVWVIDPLDGTTNFVCGVPVYCTSVGLMSHGRLVAGVIYDMNRDELFSARLGQGATLNGQPIRVSATPTLSEALLGTGFPYDKFGVTMDVFLNVLRELMRRTRGIRRLGSAALDLAYVACGRFDAFYESSLQPWDVAAGALLIQEAGGVITDYLGGNDYLFGNSIIGGNPAVHQELQNLILTYMQDEQPA